MVLPREVGGRTRRKRGKGKRKREMQKAERERERLPSTTLISIISGLENSLLKITPVDGKN